MATIYDVAKAAGVSPKTVSRVLNDDAPVNESTRQAVNEAIAALDYLPSQAARMMRSSRSRLIGLITGAISQEIGPAVQSGLPEMNIVQAIQREMSAQGKILMISDTGGRADAAPVLARTFAQHRVEGLIYVADHHREIEMDLTSGNCPVVLVNCYDAAATPCVLPDDEAGEAALVARLIEAGHRRIGFLPPDRTQPAARLRLDGYRTALAAAGLAYDPDLVAHVHDPDADRARALLTEALDALLSLDAPPSVICCTNDEMAMRLYGLLRSRGLRVPDDISVAGYDDHKTISEMLYPQLTTVVLPYSEMGRQAARLMLELIEGKPLASPGPTLVDGPVVWRSSVTATEPVDQLFQGRKTS
ncbi:transcriptional regulator, LacI family protein [Oceanicola granulosus HTCC2516]|uniref:Transcriptional regulator, LacI family protein n=1 Tax=Oceanicola granulosus (strain ATCC BAA-861 / DSM 15982 / KCTC 12143 / HTCC2516) TaxID=314256 RepID=Q2CGA8_OCEGH|nr:LacI family DNA-binding transcriptional regulator [Oceanicola granulosus]EAR51810.1 transcriptional regulator, LacI family protein [Oceanicola granulosus HTCC2516]